MGSKIEWTDEVINTATGCTKISPGCQNCYMFRIAESMKRRLGPTGPYPNGPNFTLHPERIKKFHQLKNKRVFVGSMTDMFHELMPKDHLDDVFDAMEVTESNTYLILTKRTERMKDYLQQRWNEGPQRALPSPEHIWIGTSIENQWAWDKRIEILRDTPAAIKFLSMEPLIGPINDINLAGIDWVIVGGESGLQSQNIRHMEESWVFEIRKACEAQGVPFFFKQWGGTEKCKCHGAWGCRSIFGETWDNDPMNWKTAKQETLI